VAEQAQQPDQPATPNQPATSPPDQPAPSPAARPDRKSSLFIWNTKTKIALGIAAAEALIVWIKSDFTTWTVVIISIPIILFYVLAGRSLDSRLGRDISWVAATAQALAVVGVILLEILPVLTLILAAVFAAVVLVLLLSDRPQQESK
jgi:hypothetical protein